MRKTAATTMTARVTPTRVSEARITAAFVLPAATSAMLLLAAGCGEAGGSNTTLFADSAGVAIATHQGADHPLELVFHEEFRLGGSDTRPEESFFRVGAGNVGIDAEGRIYVLDTSASRVVVFDRDGRHLRTLGRSGSGPGEIGMAGGLVVPAEGGALVPDYMRGAFVRWDEGGNVLPNEPFPTGYFGGPAQVTGESIVLPVRNPDATGVLDQMLVRIHGSDTLRIAVTPPMTSSPVHFERSCDMRIGGMPPIFAPTLRWRGSGRRIVVATGAAYELDVFEDGVLSRRVRRTVAPRPATERLAVEHQDVFTVRTEGGDVTCDPRELIEQVGFEPVIPAVGMVAIAPDGRLWVERGGVRGEPRAIDLFSADGTYEGTLPAGTPFPVAFFPDGRIAAGETDELEVTRLVVYRVGE